jgi:uncharacterized protein YggU (UPF0235/DUF167 family)
MLIKVAVQAGAKKDQVILKKEKEFLVETRQPAKEGKANQAVRLLLADYLGIPLNKIRLIRGRIQPHKIFRIYSDDRKND